MAKDSFSKARTANREKAKAIEALTSDTKPKKRGRKKSKPEDTMRFNGDIEAKLYLAFQEKCAEEGRTMLWCVTRFMEEYVEGNITF